MKISQEVRDYANGEEGSNLDLSFTPTDIEAGMQEMSRKFKELGSEVYIDESKLDNN